MLVFEIPSEVHLPGKRVIKEVRFRVYSNIAPLRETVLIMGQKLNFLILDQSLFLIL